MQRAVQIVGALGFRSLVRISSFGTHKLLDNPVTKRCHYYHRKKQYRVATDCLGSSVEELANALRHHGKGTRLLKLNPLHSVLRRAETDQDIDEVLSLLKLYTTKAIEFTSETATLFVRACCRANAERRALHHLKKRYGLGKIITLGGVNDLLFSFSKAKDIEGIMECAALADRLGLAQTPRQYYCYVKACIDAGRVDKAVELLEISRSQGISVRPAAVSKVLQFNSEHPESSVQEPAWMREPRDLEVVNTSET